MIWRTRSIGGEPVILDFSTPKIMGILNVTPDSFYDGGKFSDPAHAVEQALRMLHDGAHIIDVGAVSTRPGATAVDEAEEWKRLEPVLQMLREKIPAAVVSVDTSSASAVLKAAEAGAGIINDISGGNFDPELIHAVAQTGLPYILMHIAGNPQTMQQNPQYENVTEDVYRYFEEKITELKTAGISQLMIDPGFGFGKTVEHNYTLLGQLKKFGSFGYPVLAGISRKSMITKLLGVTKENALNGTTAAHAVALMNGAAVLRVHDVKEAAEVIRVVSASQNP